MIGGASICWFCHWGWPEPIHTIYREALDKLDGYDSPLDYGPGHIVWADENFDSAQWCLDNFDKYADTDRYSPDELAVAREALEKLLLVPDEFKHSPAGYDGENPEKFPPPAGWVMKGKRSD